MDSLVHKKIFGVLLAIVIFIGLSFLILSIKNNFFAVNKSPIPQNYILGTVNFTSHSDIDKTQYSTNSTYSGKRSEITRYYLSLFAKEGWDVLEAKVDPNGSNSILARRRLQDDDSKFEYFVVKIEDSKNSNVTGISVLRWIK